MRERHMKWGKCSKQCEKSAYLGWNWFSATRCCVCSRHSLISCISSLSFQLTNSRRTAQIHACFILFHSPLWWPSAVETHSLFITGATKSNVLFSETDCGAKRWMRARVSVFQAAGLIPAIWKGEVSTKGTEEQPGGRNRRAWMPSMCAASWTSPQAQGLKKKKGNYWGNTCKVVTPVNGGALSHPNYTLLFSIKGGRPGTLCRWESTCSQCVDHEVKDMKQMQSTFIQVYWM